MFVCAQAHRTAQPDRIERSLRMTLEILRMVAMIRADACTRYEKNGQRNGGKMGETNAKLFDTHILPFIAIYRNKIPPFNTSVMSYRIALFLPVSCACNWFSFMFMFMLRCFAHNSHWYKKHEHSYVIRVVCVRKAAVCGDLIPCIRMAAYLVRGQRESEHLLSAQHLNSMLNPAIFPRRNWSGNKKRNINGASA